MASSLETISTGGIEPVVVFQRSKRKKTEVIVGIQSKKKFSELTETAEDEKPGRTDCTMADDLVSTEIELNIIFDSQKHLQIDDNNPRLPWKTKTKARKAINWGQLKLLCSEIQFLTTYWDSFLHPNPVVVYVGAASGHHIAFLADLFPPITFHLYDNHDFHTSIQPTPGREESSKSNVHIFLRYFTDTDVEAYKKMTSLFFICDIRDLQFDPRQSTMEGNKVNEALVWADMQLQERWVLALRPVRAYLKFRLPYAYDFAVTEGKTRLYLKGTVYRQGWAWPASTETRLVPSTDYTQIEWDYVALEDKLFYHNMVIREHSTFLNPLDGSKNAVAPELGITRDWDSTFTVIIAMAYLWFIGEQPTLERIRWFLEKVLAGATGGGKAARLVDLRSDGYQNDSEA